MPLALLLWACEDVDAAPGTGPVVIQNARLPGGASVDLEIRDGRFSAIGKVDPALPKVDLHGATVVPAFVDSHVHLAYYAVGKGLLDKGVAAAVISAAPLAALTTPAPGGPRLLQSGPMITAPGGYPTRSWGSGGYGLECATPDAAEAAVRSVHSAGARVIKVPFEAPTLSDEALERVVATAHQLGLPVVAHALDEAGAARAAAAGIHGLAHTPVEKLTPATIAAWSNRFVISTLRAFGGSPDAVENLRALREAGATVLYGTDLGNTRDVGIDVVELGLLQQAGMDGAAILAAGTSTPAAKWGWSDLGAIEVGKAASFLVVDGDPLADPQVLGKPKQVWIGGVRR